MTLADPAVNRSPGHANPNPYHRSMPSSAPVRPSWTFLTNHAHVLIALSRDPELRQRDISQLVGITEGAVQRILHDLEEAGFLMRERVGRRNRYHIDADHPLRHPLERQQTVAEILRSVNQTSGSS